MNRCSRWKCCQRKYCYAGGRNGSAWRKKFQLHLLHIVALSWHRILSSSVCIASVFFSCQENHEDPKKVTLCTDWSFQRALEGMQLEVDNTNLLLNELYQGEWHEEGRYMSASRIFIKQGISWSVLFQYSRTSRSLYALTTRTDCCVAMPSHILLIRNTLKILHLTHVA